jgi:hypothetical protein
VISAAPATAVLAGTATGFPVEAPADTSAAATTVAAATPVVMTSMMITVAAAASRAVPVAGAPQAVAVSRVRGHRRRRNHLNEVKRHLGEDVAIGMGPDR